MGACRTSRPRLITIASSASCAISASTWLERARLCPRRRSSAAGRGATGSPGVEAVRRLVEDQDAGGRRAAPRPARAAGACPASTCRRCAAPLPRGRPSRGPRRPVADRDPRRRREDPQVVPAAPQRVEALRLEHGAHGARPGARRLAYGIPSTVAEPSVGDTRPRTIRSVVLLPAPFGPRNPVTTPGWTSRLRSSTAVTDPKRFVTPRTEIAGNPSGARSADGQSILLLASIISAPSGRVQWQPR